MIDDLADLRDLNVTVVDQVLRVQTERSDPEAGLW